MWENSAIEFRFESVFFENKGKKNELRRTASVDSVDRNEKTRVDWPNISTQGDALLVALKH